MRTSLAFRYCIMIMYHFQCAHRSRARRSTRPLWRRLQACNIKRHKKHRPFVHKTLPYNMQIRLNFDSYNHKDNTTCNPNTPHANRDNKAQVGSIDLIGKYVDYRGIFTLRDVGMELLLISLWFVVTIGDESDSTIWTVIHYVRCLSKIFGIKSRVWDVNRCFYGNVMTAIETFSRRSEIDQTMCCFKTYHCKFPITVFIFITQYTRTHSNIIQPNKQGKTNERNFMKAGLFHGNNNRCYDRSGEKQHNNVFLFHLWNVYWTYFTIRNEEQLYITLVA